MHVKPLQAEDVQHIMGCLVTSGAYLGDAKSMSCRLFNAFKLTSIIQITEKMQRPGPLLAEVSKMAFPMGMLQPRMTPNHNCDCLPLD